MSMFHSQVILQPLTKWGQGIAESRGDNYFYRPVKLRHMHSIAGTFFLSSPVKNRALCKITLVIFANKPMINIELDHKSVLYHMQIKKVHINFVCPDQIMCC